MNAQISTQNHRVGIYTSKCPCKYPNVQFEYPIKMPVFENQADFPAFLATCCTVILAKMQVFNSAALNVFGCLFIKKIFTVLEVDFALLLLPVFYTVL